jgi:outer membrane receptor protein involved in Fe transport
MCDKRPIMLTERADPAMTHDPISTAAPVPSAQAGRVGLMALAAAWVIAAILAAAPASAQDEALPVTAPAPAPSPAADTPPAAGTDVYPRAFFDRFFPQTALEMLQRVPGFALQRGAELRGFAGAAGNVLIDGERPTIKSGGLEDFLTRIPADAVERIEVTRGAQRAGETAGQSIIANVIRKSRGVAGTWSAELERNTEGLIYPRAEIAIAAPLGDWRTTTKLNAFWEQFVFTDFDRQRFDGAGNLLFFDAETLPSTLGEAFIATEAKRTLAGGTLTLNGRFGYSKFYQETGRDGFAGRRPDGGRADRRTDIRLDSEFIEGEASADWAGNISPRWTLKLLALGTLRDGNVASAARVAEPVTGPASVQRFASESRPLELLTRATLGRLSGAFRPEFGVELAYNRLQSRIALAIEDAAGGVRPVPLPASDVVVAEWRGEAFANLAWQVAARWTIEAGLAAEQSRIAVTGDASGENSFFFWKPSLALTYQPSPKLQLRAAMRRTVGQLNFNDFAASANAEDDRLLAGNPDLGPDSLWRGSVTADYRLASGFAFNLEAFHEWRSDVLEQIILPSGVAGLANAGAARVWGAQINGALPLRALLPGGLIEVSSLFRDARFDDPITGETRRVTGLTNPIVTINLRQDLTAQRLAWGVRYEPPREVFIFFANEAIVEERTHQITAFIETTRFLGVRMQLEVRNIGGQEFPRDRLLFAPDRSGAFLGSEVLRRRRGEFVKFTISDQF